MSMLSDLGSNSMEIDGDEGEKSQIPTASLVAVDCNSRNFPPSAKNIRITNEKFTIGRSFESNFKLSLPTISRKHFTLEKSAITDEWSFILHATKNEVLVNDIRVEKEAPIILRHNDKINLKGLVTFAFKCRADDDNGFSIPFQQHNYNSSSMNSPRESTVTASTLSLTRLDPCDFDNPDRNALSPLPPIDDVDSSHSFSLDFGVPSMDDHEVSTSLNDLKTVAHNCYEWLNDNVDKYRYKPTADEALIRHYDSLLKYLKLFDQLKIVDNVAVAESNCGSYGCNYTLVVSTRNLNLKRLELDSLVELAKTHDFERMIYRLESFLWTAVGESSKELKEFIEKNMTGGRSEDDTTWGKLKSIYGSLDAKMKRIDMLLEERDKLKSELELIMEENESLTCKTNEMKKNIANAEVLALEYECLKESTKYREDDKRSKDALEKTIAGLQADVNSIKNEKEKLSSSVIELERKYSDLEGKNAKLEQKCESLELKLEEKSQMAVAVRTSIACSSGDNDDMVSDIKSNWLELMESHFNCSICGEMFIEPTVTNCNHVFCAYCIKEWKKKKKICPFCRSPLNKECKATFIDDYITSLLKTMSANAYNDRLKTIEERNASKTPIPAKRARVSAAARRGRNVVVIGVAPNANPPVVQL